MLIIKSFHLALHLRGCVEKVTIFCDFCRFGFTKALLCIRRRAESLHESSIERGGHGGVVVKCGVGEDGWWKTRGRGWPRGDQKGSGGETDPSGKNVNSEPGGTEGVTVKEGAWVLRAGGGGRW